MEREVEGKEEERGWEEGEGSWERGRRVVSLLSTSLITGNA
jgi:hypothetical protein